MNPTTMTPSEIDTQLAELYMARLANNHAREIALNAIHSAVGSREYVRGSWGQKGHYENRLTDDNAITQLQRLIAAEIEPWHAESRQAHLNTITACDAEDARITDEQRPLNAEYNRRPWSRFFLVTSSDGGHIHSSMSCHTCRFSTTYGWKPELSGQTEVEAVEACGPALCTACFPSAPTEWTSAKLTKTGRLSRAR